ncbi:MAG: RNA polymerase subunit sigma-70 [Acidimicrobiales bacterium]
MSTTGIAPIAPNLGTQDLEPRLEEHRAALTAHCRRLLGSGFEAEDAVQETLVRAWRALDRFEGRSSLRTWLHRIATNVCLDMQDATQRRARPVDFTSWKTPGSTSDGAPAGGGFVHPFPGCHASRVGDDPAEQAVARDAIQRAFVLALLQLPPRQRSVLLLREVLRWKATEVAELLGTTVASVNSMLQRARSTLAAGRGAGDRPHRLDDRQRPLLQDYVDAFEHHDIDSLVSMLV